MQLLNIKLSEIATPSMVRTQNGHDKESLTELAASMSNALLQPILVRAAEEGDDTPLPWVVIAGRRRIAAAKLLKWEEIEALTKDTDATAAYLSEITENIQRVDMTLADTARAVRTLMATFDDQKAVQKFLSKSASWVSKHLAVTSSKCPAEVKGLMENGHVQDVETLLLLKSIAELSPAKYQGAPAAFQRMIRIAGTGGMSRALARDTLAKLKEPEAEGTTTVGVKRLTTSQTVTDERSSIEIDPKTSFAIVLPIELLELMESKGGSDAVIALMKKHSEGDWLEEAAA